MADKSLSELNNTTSSNDQDLYLVSQKNASGKYESKKIDWSNIKNNIKTYLQGFFVRTDNTNQEIDGTKTFKGKFVYSGMEEANTNANRTIWFSDNSTQGKPVYDNDFKYNPVSNVLDVKKLNTGVSLVASPSDTAIGHEVVDAAWVRKVIQVDDDTVVHEYVSANGNDANDGKTQSKSKRTITSAMEVLNKYRISSANGLTIILEIDGDYDIYENGNEYPPIIAHADAVNQNTLAIIGNGNKVYSSYPVQSGNWYILLKTMATNLMFSNIHLRGFSRSAEVQGQDFPTLNTPGTLSFYSSEITMPNGVFTYIFNEDCPINYIDFFSYFATNIQMLNGKISQRCCVRSDFIEGIPLDEQSFDDDHICKMIFKNTKISSWDLIWQHRSPYTNYKWRLDIILDNVTCKLSSKCLGTKLTDRGINGSEYHCYYYLLNGTNLGAVFPNVPSGGDSYNHRS